MVHPGASTNFASAHFYLEPGARLEIHPASVTERRPGGVCFWLGAGAHVTVGEGAWLRSDLGAVHLVAFAGARLEVGVDAFLNGCHLSAKQEVRIGRRAWIGPGTRVFDADQHDFDDQSPERVEAIRIGDHVWIASDVTVLRGVSIGDHSVVAARSVVTRDVPPHTLVRGAPARPAGTVGDRSLTR